MLITTNKIIFNSKSKNFNKNELVNNDLSTPLINFTTKNCTDNMQANATTKAIMHTKNSLLYNNLLGSYVPFVKVFIVRGIGYQADVIENFVNSLEFPYYRYLSLRVGHSFLICKPIPSYIGVKVCKKDRKLIIYGTNKELVSNFSKVVYKLRPPSVYTGRGIRIKKGMHRRKLGKKDIRKGKI